MSKEYYIPASFQEQQELLEYLKHHKGLLAVDTEATGPNDLTDSLIGISFSREEGEAFYFPTIGIEDERMHELRVGVIEILENPDTKIVMHNSVYDVSLLRRTIGVDCLPNLHADTILMKHTIRESRPHGLKECGVKYLGPEWKDEQDDLKKSVLANGGKWTKNEKNFDKADINILGKYACADADMTLRLYHFFSGELTTQKLDKFFYTDEVMPLNKIVINMHIKGMKVDLDYFTTLKEELEKEAKGLEEKAHDTLREDHDAVYNRLEDALLDKKVPVKATGRLLEQLYVGAGLPIVHHPKTGKPTFTKKVIEDMLEEYPDNFVLLWKLEKKSVKKFSMNEQFALRQARKAVFRAATDNKYVINLGSNDQLAEILFTNLGEEARDKTAGGKDKVDESMLESLRNKYKFVDCIMQLRKIRKLLSTYVEAAISKNIQGAVHPNWLQYGTDSGRFASREPNYQNLPRDDKRIKYGIVSRDGRSFVGADYSQLEPRCFAHCSNEQALIDSYTRGDDLYGTIALELFGLKCTPNEVKVQHPDERQIAKTVALAITYGAKKWKIQKVVNQMMKKEVLTLPEAERLIKKYFKKFPQLDRYIKRCHGQLLMTGKVVNETGRIRHLEEINNVKNSRDRQDIRLYNSFLNLSTNFPIQSLAASIVNRAMIALNRKFKEKNIDADILMQVHDEIVVECKDNDVTSVVDLMKTTMESTYKLKLPLVAEPKIGKRLSETK